MTYLQFHLVFILPVIGLLGALIRRRLAERKNPRDLWSLGAIVVVALAYTTPWDNYLVYRGVWSYGADRVIGVIGYVPVEEYLFFILQPILTGFWVLYLLDREGDAPATIISNRARWIGGLIGAALTLYGIWGIGRDEHLYAGLILAWAGPVLAGQWAYSGRLLWARRRVWAIGVAAPTLYLWAADRLAIGMGIWDISGKYTTGLHLFGLPIEEALFFLVTNLLVVQGLLMFLFVELPSESRALVGTGVSRPPA